MKCTACDRKVQPIIAVDIDETLGMYHEHFRHFAMQYWQRPLAPNYDGSCKFGDWLGLTTEAYRECKLAYRQGGGKRTMPIYQGARWFIQTVHDAGAEVWLTTTRPYLRLDSTDPDTRFWLETHGIKYDALLYDDDKYQRLAQHVDPERVVMVLDDLDVQVSAATELFGDAAWMIQRQSNHASSHQKVKDLYQAGELAQQLIADWNNTHGS